jgi:hypothetical protein
MLFAQEPASPHGLGDDGGDGAVVVVIIKKTASSILRHSVCLL